MVGVVTDDFVVVHRLESPLKQFVLDLFSLYETITAKDPLKNFISIHFTRNRSARIITLSQPQLVSVMNEKYPLPEGKS